MALQSTQVQQNSDGQIVDQYGNVLTPFTPVPTFTSVDTTNNPDVNTTPTNTGTGTTSQGSNSGVSNSQQPLIQAGSDQGQMAQVPNQSGAGGGGGGGTGSIVSGIFGDVSDVINNFEGVAATGENMAQGAFNRNLTRQQWGLQKAQAAQNMYGEGQTQAANAITFGEGQKSYQTQQANASAFLSGMAKGLVRSSTPTATSGTVKA